MESITVRGALLLALGAGTCSLPSNSSPELIAGAPRVDTFRVVNTYPHDPAAYTQGLLYRDGFLFESTGLNGQSTLRKVKLETGEVLQQHRLGKEFFAEGLAEWNGQLVQLTWRSNIAFVYDVASFSMRRTFEYTGEGWGEIARDVMAEVAREFGAGLFRRFDIMHSWYEDGMPYAQFVQLDGLHLNDFGQKCIGKLLTRSILSALTGP